MSFNSLFDYPVSCWTIEDARWTTELMTHFYWEDEDVGGREDMDPYVWVSYVQSALCDNLIDE